MDRQSSFSSAKKSPSRKEETIAAISTPFGKSGIGVVRISGSSAEAIARKLFRPKIDQGRFVSHHFHYGEIIDSERGKAVDEVLIVLMKSPKTYTKEDIVEIHCHGGYFILQRILELVLREGACMAQPGEFTKRAFLNGRIDLTQAEAVIDLIDAKTQAALEIAHQQLSGLLLSEIVGLKERLVDHLARIEAHIDFPDEEIDPILFEDMGQELERMIHQIRGWIESYGEGKIFREGIRCAIVGKTNVGKSSLLNILLREERAIVTPIPGTTRDVIEGILNIHGIPLCLMDTAGLRKAVDSIEHEGVKRAKEKAAASDLVLLVLDGSRALDEDDREIFEDVKGKKRVVVLNKGDLPQETSMNAVRVQFMNDPVVSISALRDEGIEELKKTIYSCVLHHEIKPTPEYLIVANIRHKTVLDQARDFLSNALEGIRNRSSLEFIAFEIRSALEALGEMVGETTSEEVLNRIFEQFCIGK